MLEWVERKKKITELIYQFTPLREAGNTFTIKRTSGWVTITFKKPLENNVNYSFLEGLLLGAGLVGTYYPDWGPMCCSQASLSFAVKEK